MRSLCILIFHLPNHRRIYHEPVCLLAVPYLILGCPDEQTSGLYCATSNLGATDNEIVVLLGYVLLQNKTLYWRNFMVELLEDDDRNRDSAERNRRYWSTWQRGCWFMPRFRTKWRALPHSSLLAGFRKILEIYQEITMILKTSRIVCIS